MRRLLRAAAGLVPVAALPLIAACASGDAGVSADTSRQLPPGYVIDSIHPPEEALRRFRHGLDSTEALNGFPDRDSLLRAFVARLKANDGEALAAMAVNRAEFAWLVYPQSRVSRPPYSQPPEIAWMMLRQASDAGLRRLVTRASSMEPLGFACPDSVEMEGTMRTLSGCTIRVRAAGATRDLHLFGRVVELHGRWKVMGYDGDL